MRPADLRAGVCSPPPASTKTWRETCVESDLSDAEKRRRRKARAQARSTSAAILWERERTIDEQKTQIREHGRTLGEFRR